VVTGDVSHHQAIAALDRGLAVIDAGHVPTERPGVAALLARMRERWPRVADLTLDPDPWRGAG
jgi:putative NIF3 family GTP cyclohydrolase 1 type 2